METQSPQPRRRSALQWGLPVIVLAALAGMGLLYSLGSSDQWEPVDWDSRSPLEVSIDRATLSPGGDHLLWVDIATGSLCVYDLVNEGRVACLYPGSCPAVVPIGVVDGDLLALRPRFERGFFQTLSDGFARLMPRRSLRDPENEAIPLGTRRTTSLERVEIDTGKVIAKAAGKTAIVALDNLDPTGFEMGAVSLSPGGRYLAWWTAVEESQGNPLSATVTEDFDLLATDPGLTSLFSWDQATWGNLSIRSSLLRRVGTSIWIDPETCLFLSFFNGGSLIPIDAAAQAPLAAFPLAAVIAKLAEVDPHVVYGPEGFFEYSPEEGSNPEVVFWARQEDSAHFFHFDSSLRFIRETKASTKGFGFGDAVWLARSQMLLVEDPSRNRLVCLSPTGSVGPNLPLPAGWEEGFQILGESSSGAIIGTNRRVFLKTRPAAASWDVIEFF